MSVRNYIWFVLGFFKTFFLRPFFYDLFEHFFEDFNLRNKFSFEHFFVEDKKLDLFKKKKFGKIKF